MAQNGGFSCGIFDLRSGGVGGFDEFMIHALLTHDGTSALNI